MKTKVAQHTPGPWSTDGRFIVASPVFKKAQPGCPFIADCLISERVRTSGTTAGNAQLIAAAPDLLEACEAAIYHLELMQDCRHLNAQLKSAITKAKGKP
jgi:hypothetical protein